MRTEGGEKENPVAIWGKWFQAGRLPHSKALRQYPECLVPDILAWTVWIEWSLLEGVRGGQSQMWNKEGHRDECHEKAKRCCQSERLKDFGSLLALMGSHRKVSKQGVLDLVYALCF